MVLRVYFQPKAKLIEVTTNMQIVTNKALLMTELANAIIQEVVRGKANEDLAVWKDIKMVKDLLEGSLEQDIDPTNLQEEVQKILGNIIVEVKKLKDNHLANTSYLDSLRVPKDSDSLLPKDLRSLFATLAMRKDQVLEFHIVSPVSRADLKGEKTSAVPAVTVPVTAQEEGVKKDPPKFVKNGLSSATN